MRNLITALTLSLLNLTFTACATSTTLTLNDGGLSEATRQVEEGERAFKALKALVADRATAEKIAQLAAEKAAEAVKEAAEKAAAEKAAAEKAAAEKAATEKAAACPTLSECLSLAERLKVEMKGANPHARLPILERYLSVLSRMETMIPK